MNAVKLSMAVPRDVAKALAERARALRLLKGWKQNTLAERAGVTFASYRRFELTGKASLELVLKVAHTLARLEEFEQLFQPPAARSLQELEQRAAKPARKRGRL